MITLSLVCTNQQVCVCHINYWNVNFLMVALSFHLRLGAEYPKGISIYSGKALYHFFCSKKVSFFVSSGCCPQLLKKTLSTEIFFLQFRIKTLISFKGKVFALHYLPISKLPFYYFIIGLYKPAEFHLWKSIKMLISLCWYFPIISD